MIKLLTKITVAVTLCLGLSPAYSQNSADQTFWQSIDKGNLVELQLYLRQFPNGVFSQLAKQRIVDAEAKNQAPTAEAKTTNPAWVKISERYYSRGDEVADRYSRLVWRRCLEGTTWDGNACQGTAKLFKGDDTIVVSMPSPAGWRLPSIHDFFTLKTTGKKTNGLFIEAMFALAPTNGVYATTTPVIGQPNVFWHFQFHLAEEHCFEEARKQASLVRLVRSLTDADRIEPLPKQDWTYLTERFRTKGAEVLDTQTNLVWKRCSEGMQWNGTGCSGNALEFAWVDVRKFVPAAEFVEQGYRVPERSEVRSIFERNTCSYEAQSDYVFQDVSSNNYFWTTSVAAIGASGTYVTKLANSRENDTFRNRNLTLLRMVRPNN
jgi:Protein of unknown function (DUF1566)